MSALIGISGKIGCGKSTLSNLLANRLGWRVLSFGGLLKDEASAVFGFPRVWCDTPEGKRRTVKVGPSVGLGATATVRQLLQYWGTDVCRKKDPDCWARAMARAVDSSARSVIIDDVRFANEARMILGRGGILVRLDPYPGWKPGTHAEHESETALDAWPEWTLRVAPLMGELEAVAETILGAVLVHGLVDAVEERIKGMGVADGCP